MSHPISRAERRHQRNRVISKRKFIHRSMWGKWVPHGGWGVYAKFNMGCGCQECHYYKYFKHRRKRRRLRDHATSPVEFRRGVKGIR